MKYNLNFNECFFLFLALNTPFPASKIVINYVYAMPIKVFYGAIYTKDLGSRVLKNGV
jgi:hypothetical protein